MRLGRHAPVVLALALSGCGSIGAIGLGSFDNERPKRPVQAQSDTMAPTQSAPVEAAPLPPPPGAQASADPLAPPPLDGTTSATPDVAALPPAAAAAPATPSGAEIGRTDLLGGWTVSSSGQSCQLFMTLTSWTGGYRASTRGCQDGVLKSISAWSLAGNQVVLSGEGGTPVARLHSAGGNRFDGQTEQGGQPITFFR
ncbi:protease inhibitor Inh/omp19 family protein [Prosthecomicrobium pneumaticum]|uniref:Alkaline proteinase inhibitor/ Outer membrane lipoprotein Omp19 domain-containing protein n=1 Tax=Prosthecomicrobium pneumaticum TaxID=81895 RepID=A0A7W9L2K9_9HYPH|nr:protease inhibitor Inh/omp19 family protein [Prosthecomicrobium pneumaticum]MBB5753606.1 hypothetical protein [Prosthecomicrobium pneumaticum]